MSALDGSFTMTTPSNTLQDAHEFIDAMTQATIPRTLRLLDESFPSTSNDRVELLSRLLALGVMTYLEHAANYRAMRHASRAWSAIGNRDARGTAGAIVRALATIALFAEPLRLSKRTYRALLGREVATRFGNDALRKILGESSLVSRAKGSGDAAGTAAVGAPMFARTALDAAANGVEAFVGLLYHSHCLFASNFWSAPFLIGCALYGQAQQLARTGDGLEAKREAHRAETAVSRLRELLVHAEANGEAIALANGSVTETEEAMATLEAGQEFTYRREVLNARMRFPCDVYNSAANLLPIASVLPRLLSGRIVELWDLQVAVMSFSAIRAALGELVRNASTLNTAEAHATHVSNLHDALDAVAERTASGVLGMRVQQPEDSMSLVEVDCLSIYGHDSREIIRALDFVLCRGDSLAIVGSAGCGKTLLVKTLVGLWSHGSGGVRVIERARVCVLSRKPYLPKGALLDVCLYPTSSADIGGETRELLVEVMITLGLGRFVEHLDDVAAWGDKLSLSEQQRIAACRAVVNRAGLCILDDATCAMDPMDRSTTYDILKKYVGGILSFGDEVSLPKLHNRTLRVHSDGTWSEFESVLSPRGGATRSFVEDIAQRASNEMNNESTSATESPMREESPARTAQSFSPLQMDASRKENKFIRQQKKNVARALGVKPEKLGVVPTPPPNKPVKRSPASSKSLSFDPLG